MLSFLFLMIWGALWMLTWPVVTAYRYLLKRPRADNCFTWAIRRWHDEDGYLVIRWCRSSKTSIKWPHFLWLPIDKSEHVMHFLPKKEDQGTSFFPDVFFEGKVITGDNKKELEN